MEEDWGSSNLPEYSVSELSGALKRSVEDQFGFVRVRAELSGVKRAASGHLYFALKDDKSVLDGVSWRGQAQKLSFEPEDGLEVVCSGKLTTYAARSKYQMVVDTMEPAGAGALMALLEERKKKLAAEGLFEAGRKKPIPFLPKVIGVITSPTGAVIRDILHRLGDRFPRHVIVWPVKVQGQGAASEIAAAIDGFNNMDEDGEIIRPDVLIVARGGGSIEDLWSFNEEEVVRAAARSDIPLISAVGHETDTTLIDYASDLRAPTPTGAAEMTVPVREELVLGVGDLGRRLLAQKNTIVQSRTEAVAGLARAMPAASDLLGLLQQRFDDLSERLPKALFAVVQQKRVEINKVSGGLSANRLLQLQQFKAREFSGLAPRLPLAFERMLSGLEDRTNSATRMLESLSFKRVLERGYAVVETSTGQLVGKTADLNAGDHVAIQFADGSVSAEIASGTPQRVKAPQPPVSKAAKKKNNPKKDDRQGSLL